MSVSYVVEALSGVVVAALAVDIALEVLADVNVNVSAAVMTALELTILIS